MNRPLTEVYSTATRTSDGEEVWQAETSHRYVLGLYELQNRITSAFPHILLENCASGGESDFHGLPRCASHCRYHRRQV